MTSEREGDGRLIDLVADYGDRAMEVVLSEDVLKHIPVLKTALAIKSAVRTVQDEMLLRKLSDILEGLSDVPQEQRRKMVQQLESDPKYAHRVGEHLVELADRVERRRKPRMIGLVLAALARGQIERVTFERLVGAIERLPVIDLDTPRMLVNTGNNQPERDRIDPESVQALVGAGLTSFRSMTPLGGARIHYDPNGTCLKFVELNLDVKTAEAMGLERSE